MEIRTATKDDLLEVVKMLADDELGKTREVLSDPLPDHYQIAFDEIQIQNGNDIFVAVTGEKIIGCYQLTLIPNLSRSGMLRAQIEGVRVHKDWRGKGVGETLIRDAISKAENAGCGMVQLTTDKKREKAIHFYEKLGFEASHLGMKLHIPKR